MTEIRTIGLLLAFVIGIISGGAISDRIYGPQIDYLIKHGVSLENEIKSAQDQNLSLVNIIKRRDREAKIIREALSELGLGEHFRVAKKQADISIGGEW